MRKASLIQGALLVCLLLGSFFVTLLIKSPDSKVEPRVSASNIEVVETVAPIEGHKAEDTTQEFVLPQGFAATSFPVERFQGYTSPFGYRTHPISGAKRFHFGLDIGGPWGSPLYAWADGTVIQTKKVDDNDCGVFVNIKTGPWTSLYCHCTEVLVNEGDQVKAGQLVATLGTTGSSTGPHLHWGLKYDGLWVDPNIVLLAMKNSQQ